MRFLVDAGPHLGHLFLKYLQEKQKKEAANRILRNKKD